MRKQWVLGLVVVLAGAAVVAVAGEPSLQAKPKRKPAPVSIVQTGPLSVEVSGTPLPVAVESLPSLDVRVTNAEIAVAPAATRSLVVSDLDGVTLSQSKVSADEIDCDGYRDVSVFVTHGGYGGSSADAKIEWGHSGFWTSQNPTSGGTQIPNSKPLLLTSSVLGPKMRITIFTTVVIPDVKVIVYLRR